jgi:HNH endonuclease
VATIIRKHTQFHYDGIKSSVLHELFDFDFRNGNIFDKVNGRSKIISADSNGYPRVTLAGKHKKAHCVLFLAHHHYLPPVVDHIDRNKSNLAINNLRPSNHLKNVLNISIPSHNTSGAKHVYRHKDERRKQFQVYFGSGRTEPKIWLESFETLEEAHDYARAVAPDFGRDPW